MLNRRQFIKSVAICASAGAFGLPAMGKEKEYRRIPELLQEGINAIFGKMPNKYEVAAAIEWPGLSKERIEHVMLKGFYSC